MTVIAGGCLCGAVRYIARSEPLVIRACWCRVCQYFACGNATINLAFPKNRLTLSGKLRVFRSKADSGRSMRRRFCPSCGVHLFSEADERPDMVIVRAGTLDDPGIAAPSALMWTASAPAWACLDASLPQSAGQPPPPTLEPER
jgi:hypothetical protein